MTPDDFPDHESYLKYVEQCEESMPSMSGHISYWQYTEIESFGTDHSTGFKILYSYGGFYSSGYSQAMVRIKHDTCNGCSKCFTDDLSHKDHLMNIREYEADQRTRVFDWLNNDLGLSKETVPDYTLSERAPHP